MNEESIFAAAIERPAEERQRYLDQVCGDNSELRARVESLLNAHEQPDSFLNNPVQEVEPTIDLAIGAINPGKKIGPYTLRERLGAGGMGVVWAAEQKAPLRRKVALKVIKPGMDTEQVIGRFENEREALALMDHPNIAKVLDAGATEKGHPYFVMELICGVPITEYCDAMRLTVIERLELFIQVCNAVQHAHQKGIIHRDIKPNNVLVSEHDGTPIPKIIDFGIAKALHRPLTDHSIYTGVFQALGTLAYMSPEQAGLSVTDIDTRSDIYGLGVLLYELLTGDTPFEKEKLASAALNEACRIIREEDPPKPSSKVSTLGKRAHEVSEGRRTDPKELDRLISGDLDCIIGKALEKDRKRRYETARDLATDVKRHLGNDIVEARPPSNGYRLWKTYRRNRTMVVSGALVTLALLLGIFGTGFLAIKWRAVVKRIGEVALTSAIQNVTFGDEESADQAITVAIDANVDQWKIEFVQALQLLYGKDARQADACNLARRLFAELDSIAIRALFANAILWSGEGKLEEHYHQLVYLQHQLPEPGIAAILVAQSLGVIAPDRSEELLTSCPRSPIAHGLLAQVLHDRAIETGDLQMELRALSHMRAARLFLPDSSMLRGLNVSICRALYQLSGEETREQYVREALEIMKEVEGSPPPVELLSWVNFFSTIGDEDKLVQLDKELIDRQFQLGSVIPRILRRIGYQSTRDTMAETLSLPKSEFIESRQGPMLLFRALDHDSHRQVLETIKSEDVSSPTLFLIDRRVPFLAAALLAGGRNHQQVSRIVRELDKYELTDFRRPIRFCEFVEGKVNSETFLAENLEKTTRRSISCFFAGIVAMSEGNRSAAEKYFYEATQLGPASSAFYEWAKTLHELLVDEDPILDWVDDRAADGDSE